MIKLVVTCDNCGRKIEDPTEEPFYHVTIREKCENPDSAVYTVDQYDMILCNECEGRLHEKPEAAVEEKPKAEVPEEKQAKEKKQAAVPEKPKAAVEEVAPVQLTGGEEESGSGSRESSPEERVESDEDRERNGHYTERDQSDRKEM